MNPIRFYFQFCCILLQSIKIEAQTKFVETWIYSDVVFNTDLLLSDVTFYRKTNGPVTTPIATKESIADKIIKIVIATPQITKSELANLCDMTVDGIRYHLSKKEKSWYDRMVWK